MSPSLQNRNAPSKNCTASGCGGMMTLHSGQEAAGASDTDEGASGAAWVCDNDPTHAEAVTAADRRALSGR